MPSSAPRFAHLFSTPLVRWRNLHGADDGDRRLYAVKQHDHAWERREIMSALASVRRGIEFRSEVANEHSFLFSLTDGCRVLHFTWNGDRNLRQVVVENDEGVASPVNEERIRHSCGSRTDKVPRVVVLSASSAKLVAEAFLRSGIAHVVAIETTEDDPRAMGGFVRTFYGRLAKGYALQDAFNMGVAALQVSERDRCVLLPRGANHSISPFNDAKVAELKDVTPQRPYQSGVRHFCGREVQVHDIYDPLVKGIKVITIEGPSGIGKTAIALQTMAYAYERRLFGDIFYVQLQDGSTGVTVTSEREVVARFANVFKFTPADEAAHPDRLVGCIQSLCSKRKKRLLVLDGCSPWLIKDTVPQIQLSPFIKQLQERVDDLQLIVTMISKVRISKGKVFEIGPLEHLPAAELFVASSHREITATELQGGIVVSDPHAQDARECMRTFAGSAIMAELGGHPGAIIETSRCLQGRHLLQHEQEFLEDIIPKELGRYKRRDEEFAVQQEECRHSNWDRVTTREITLRNPTHPSPRVPAGNWRDGEWYWIHAKAQETGLISPSADAMSWEALYKHSLAPFFRERLGNEARLRPLQDEDFRKLGANEHIWSPHPPPGRNGTVTRPSFLGKFWPWFREATNLLKHSGFWGCQIYPIICDLPTTRIDGEASLHGRPPGTFLVRVSSTRAGAVVIMHVDRTEKIVAVGTVIDKRGRFRVPFGDGYLSKSLRELLLHIDHYTHLFPDTPKAIALDACDPLRRTIR